MRFQKPHTPHCACTLEDTSYEYVRVPSTDSGPFVVTISLALPLTVRSILVLILVSTVSPLTLVCFCVCAEHLDSVLKARIGTYVLLIHKTGTLSLSQFTFQLTPWSWSIDVSMSIRCCSNVELCSFTSINNIGEPKSVKTEQLLRCKTLQSIPNFACWQWSWPRSQDWERLDQNFILKPLSVIFEKKWCLDSFLQRCKYKAAKVVEDIQNSAVALHYHTIRS